MVDSVSDFRIGERPRRAMYIRMADLAVARREWISGVEFGVVGGV